MSEALLEEIEGLLAVAEGSVEVAELVVADGEVPGEVRAVWIASA